MTSLPLSRAPAGPASAAFARLSTGLDEAIVRIITARPGLEPVVAAMAALTPALIRAAEQRSPNGFERARRQLCRISRHN